MYTRPVFLNGIFDQTGIGRYSKGMFQYFANAAREFKYVRWLSLRRVAMLTPVVLLVGILTGFALGAVDSGLAGILKTVVI